MASGRNRTGKVVGAWRFLKQVFAEYGADHGGMLAGAISFYALLSLVPILLLAVAVFAAILGSPEKAYAQVTEYVRQLSPALVESQSAGIRALMDELVRGKRIAWGVGGVALAWAASQIMVTLQAAMNVVWSAPAHRGILGKRLVAFGALLTVAALFLVSLGVSTVANLVLGAKIGFLGLRPGNVPFVWHLLTAALPPALVFLMFLVVYRLLPNTRVPWSSAALGALTATALLEVARYAFGFYIRRYADFNRIYGSFTTLIVVALWVYYAAVVAILGAEVGSVHKDWRSTGDGRRPS